MIGRKKSFTVFGFSKMKTSKSKTVKFYRLIIKKSSLIIDMNIQ
jgi:hypothetical protein